MTVSRPEQRRLDLLTDVADHAAAILIEFGLSKEAAALAGESIADNLANNWGGQVMSFPRDCRFKQAKIRATVAAEFNGFNHADLARKYGLTVRYVYRIIQAERSAQKSTTGDNHVQR